MGNCFLCCCPRQPPLYEPNVVESRGNSPHDISHINRMSPVRRTPSPARTPILPTRQQIVVGIHSYRASDLKDLSFNKGDRMKLLDASDGKWILVEHMVTRRCGLVPGNFVALESSIESQDWFFANTSRKEAERLILGDEEQPEGTFLIRPSEHDPSGYSLSVRDFEADRGNHVKHYKIQHMNDDIFYISKTKSFKNLPELVSAYSRNSYNLCCVLSNPCKKSEPLIQDFNSNYRDKWEIERNEIQILRKLGKGNFGEVYYGKWMNQYEVAVKTLREGTMGAQSFLKEAAFMKTFKHKRLVRLYGVCSIDEPLYIVQEYMENGNLQRYLRKDHGRTLKFEDLIFIAFQVASGMEHLELLNFIHRDLAARNVLVGRNLEVKICDFGLARIIDKQEYYAIGGKFPIKWTAPEALQKSIFTIKSDVWSFGVLLMELFTYGETPYNDMPSMIVAEMILVGHRMAKPKNYPLPDEIYENIILRCWDANPEKRPTFKYLAKYFENIEVTYNQSAQGDKEIVISHNVPKSYEDHNQGLSFKKR